MTRAAIRKKGARPRLPTYRALGVRTFINCQGTYTVLGGSLPLAEVGRAMQAAGTRYVALAELQAAAGRWIAARTGAEWGLVTCGGAAGLCQLTAACIAGGDPEKIARLPDCSGLADEVITPRGHRHPFEHAIRMTGARIIEAESEAELEALIGPRTAMISFLGEAAARGAVPLRAAAEIGRRHGVPVVVDAAAERPDVPNRYLMEGADAVIYSGGKCLRGPQDSGLVLGRKDLLQAAAMNGSPYMGLGRPMKVSKETLMGLLAALDAWLQRDHRAEWRMWERMLAHVARRLSALAFVQCQVVQPPLPSNVVPTLAIRWDSTVAPVANTEVKRRLAEGRPSIEMPLHGEGLSIMPYMMEPGEERPVARRLVEILAAAAAGPRPADDARPAGEGQAADDARPAPSVDLSGRWELRIGFLAGEARHHLEIRQQAGTLAGLHRGRYGEAPLEGAIRGSEVRFHSVLSHGGTRLQYSFRGTAQEGMAGTVELGEFGSAPWRAAREENR